MSCCQLPVQHMPWIFSITKLFSLLRQTTLISLDREGFSNTETLAMCPQYMLLTPIISSSLCGCLSKASFPLARVHHQCLCLHLPNYVHVEHVQSLSSTHFSGGRKSDIELVLKNKPKPSRQKCEEVVLVGGNCFLKVVKFTR